MVSRSLNHADQVQTTHSGRPATIRAMAWCSLTLGLPSRRFSRISRIVIRRAVLGFADYQVSFSGQSPAHRLPAEVDLGGVPPNGSIGVPRSTDESLMPTASRDTPDLWLSPDGNRWALTNAEALPALRSQPSINATVPSAVDGLELQ